MSKTATSHVFMNFAVLETSVLLFTAQFLITVVAVVHKRGTSIIAFCVCVNRKEIQWNLG
jgi:hypothetical protein